MSSPKIITETRWLILRRQALDDLDYLFALYSDPEVIRYIPDAPRSYEETRRELTWHMNGHPEKPELGLWATIYKPTNQFIGRCGLLPWSIDGQEEVEVAYLIGREWWGQGLGTEAAKAVLEYGFEALRLPRLVSLVEEGNLASIRVAEKIGMRFEKEARDEVGPFLLYSIDRPFGI